MHFINRALLVTLASFSCQLAHADVEQRTLADFDAIEVASGIDLYLTQGTSFRLEVTSTTAAPDNILTELDNGTLRIHKERGWFSSGIWGWFADYRVDVTLPVLTRLSASGGSDVESDGTFSGESLEIHASGGSDIALDISVNTLVTTTSGGSDINLSGSANQIRAETSGGSDLDATGLTVKEADLTSSGGSDINITVLDKIIARASGGSDIVFNGDPQVRDIVSSGGSDITRH